MTKKKIFYELQDSINASDVKKIKALLDTGVKLNKEMSGRLLGAVAETNSVKIFELLSNAGFKFESQKDAVNSMINACRSKRIEMVKCLINHRVPVDKRCIYYRSSNRALMTSAESGDVQLVDLILSHQPNINAQDENGETALMLAVAKNHISVVKKLISSKAKINVKDFSGETALIIAARKKQIEILEILIANGANPNIANQRGDTPLMFAIKQPEIIKLLINKKTNLELEDIYGQSVLYLAAHNGYFESVKLLLNAGALPQPLVGRSKYNKLPLVGASGQGHLDIVKLLIKHGADINKQENSGDTALIAATKEKKLEIVEYLLSKGADPSIKMLYQGSALDLAIKNKTPEIAELLAKHAAQL